MFRGWLSFMPAIGAVEVMEDSACNVDRRPSPGRVSGGQAT